MTQVQATARAQILCRLTAKMTCGVKSLHLADSEVTNVRIRDRPIYRPGWYIGPIFGFYQYIGIGQNGQFYQPH